MTDSTPEEKLLNLIRKDQSRARIGRELKIFTKVNIILIVIIMAVAGIFLADVFIFKNKTVEVPIIDTQIKDPLVQPVTDEPKEEMPDINMVSIKKVPKEEIMANLNLLGIITGDNNQAIIEDKSLKKTFFLYKGDSLGELKVYDIKNSAVILDYKGEKIELNI